MAGSSPLRREDLKPENLMMFNGRLKLIDVDGCVPIDSEAPWRCVQRVDSAARLRGGRTTGLGF